jgi:hypothetical protein
MLRAAGWCVGLFGAGAAVSRIFPAPWFQPVVLLALGVAFLFVSRTSARSAPTAVTPLPARGAPPAPPAAAPVPFEQSA